MIRTSFLFKRYGRVRALDGLSMTVPDGAIYGFIGNNGSGKTTAIRILATLLPADGGEAEVEGLDVIHQADEVRRVLGYMPDFFGVYDDLRVDEYLDFYASLEGMNGPAVAHRRDALLELVRLGDKREEYVESLSRGMRQRLCLARSLVHDPRVLLLDEPASGLDPIARVEMRDVLKDLAETGKTILVSSHILDELAELCTHVGILADGDLIYEGTMADLLWAAQRPGYLVQVGGDPAQAASILAGQPDVGGVQAEEEGIRFHCEGGESGAARAVGALIAGGQTVTRFAPAESSLEAAYLRVVRQEGAET